MKRFLARFLFLLFSLAAGLCPQSISAAVFSVTVNTNGSLAAPLTLWSANSNGIYAAISNLVASQIIAGTVPTNVALLAGTNLFTGPTNTFLGVLKLPTGAVNGYALVTDGAGIATWQPMLASGASNSFSINGTVLTPANMLNTTNVLWIISGSNVLAAITNLADSQIASNAGIAWSKVSKVGSTIADLATRSAGDLNSGILLPARYRAADNSTAILLGSSAGLHGNESVTVGDNLINSAQGGINIAGSAGGSVTGTNGINLNAGSVSGYYATALQGADAAGDYAFAIGLGAAANLADAFSFGRNAIAGRTNQFVFGTTGMEAVFPGVIRFVQIATTTTPGAGNLSLYSKSSGGLAKLFYLQSDGTEIGPIGVGGALYANGALQVNPNLQNSSNVLYLVSSTNVQAVVTNIDGSKINSGTIADARHSTNIAQLNGTNTFSGTNTFIGLTITRGILPETGITYDLGGPSAQWNSLWVGNAKVASGLTAGTAAITNSLTLAGNNIYSLFASNNITLTVVGTQLGISSTGGSATPGGSVQQLQFNTNSLFGGAPGLLWNNTYLTLSNGNNPYLMWSQTNSLTGARNYAIKQEDSGFGFYAFNDARTASNIFFDMAGTSAGGGIAAKAYGNMTVQSNLTVNGSVTSAGLNVTGTSPIAFQISYAAADAFNFGLARSTSAQTNNIQWNLPAALPTTPSFLLITQNGATNGDGSYFPTNSLSTGSGGGNGPFTNPVTYGPRVFPIGSDSTNINWATNSYTVQTLTTNASFTNTFSGSPASGAQIIYSVLNTAASNIFVRFGSGPSGNNICLNTGQTNVTGVTVLAGESKTFEWGYNGVKYYFRYSGKVPGSTVTLTETTATLVDNFPIAAGKYVGLEVSATTFASDGTDHQTVKDTFTVSAVNKAGTVSFIGPTSISSSTIASSGTLTNGWTAVANGASLDLKLSSTSSLTQTTLQTAYTYKIQSNDETAVGRQ